jgi:heme/copper-type cytochrome/quinol oxidase subunit 2
MSEPPPPPQYGSYPGGYPPQQPQPQYGGYPPPVAAAPKNGLGTASLVVAIISLLTVFGGVVLGIVAIILGFMGRSRVKSGEATNGGVAMAGIVLGVLSLLVSIAAIVLIGVFGMKMFNEVGGTDYVDCIQKAGSDQDTPTP